MSRVAVQIVHESHFVGFSKSIRLIFVREVVEGPGDDHSAIAYFILFARQAESVHLDSVLAQTFVIEGIAIFGEVDVFKGSDNKADMLRKDRSVTGKARSLSRRVSRIENLYTLVMGM